jgi:glycosyltransferase involved in cell wall biosynthesis
MEKIVRIVTSLNFGGVEKRIEISSAEFKKREDVSLYVVAIGGGGAVAKSLKALNVETVLLQLKTAIPNLKAIIKLYKLLKSINPDVVHTSGAEANFHGLIAAYFAGVSVRIGEEIGFPNHRSFWKLTFNVVYRFASNVIGISDAVVKKIVELGEVKLSKTTVVYNPVEITDIDFRQKKAANDEFVFITVSRLVAIKNLDNLLRAFAQVCNDGSKTNIRLHIVGSGPDQPHLEQLALELKVFDKVLFKGFQTDVIPFLLQADCYILPSYSEGFSIALVEAMQARLVCLATNVGGPVEIIQENITGMLINPHNIEDIKEKMLKAIKLPADIREAMGIAARQDVLERFTPKRYVDDLLTLYKTCRK